MARRYNEIKEYIELLVVGILSALGLQYLSDYIAMIPIIGAYPILVSGVTIALVILAADYLIEYVPKKAYLRA